MIYIYSILKNIMEFVFFLCCVVQNNEQLKHYSQCFLYHYIRGHPAPQRHPPTLLKVKFY